MYVFVRLRFLFAWPYGFCLKEYNRLILKGKVVCSASECFFSFSELKNFLKFYTLFILCSRYDLDETRLTNRQINACHQHSTPVTIPTSNSALFTQSTHSSTCSPLHVTRRRPTGTSNMTSYSAIKRKAQRSDLSSSVSRVWHIGSNDFEWEDFLFSVKLIWNIFLDLLLFPIQLSVKIVQPSLMLLGMIDFYRIKDNEEIIAFFC